MGLLVAAPGCGGAQSPAAVTQEQPAREAFPQPLELIPNEASGLLGLNPTVFAGSAFARQLADELKSEPQFQEARQALHGCGLTLASFEAVFMGSHEQEFALVLAGSGLGADTNAVCIIEAAQRFVGAQPAAKISVDAGKKIIDFPDGRVYLVNNDLLVLTTAAWQASVDGLIDGEGESAAKQGKRELLATLDMSAALWLAADVPPGLVMAANFMGIPEAAAAQNLSGTLQLEPRTKLELTAGFGSTAEAQTAAAGLDALLSKPVPDAPAALSSALGRVHVGHVSSQVRLSLEISTGDFAAFAAANRAL